MWQFGCDKSQFKSLLYQLLELVDLGQLLKLSKPQFLPLKTQKLPVYLTHTILLILEIETMCLVTLSAHQESA